MSKAQSNRARKAKAAPVISSDESYKYHRAGSAKCQLRQFYDAKRESGASHEEARDATMKQAEGLKCASGQAPKPSSVKAWIRDWAKEAKGELPAWRAKMIEERNARQASGEAKAPKVASAPRKAREAAKANPPKAAKRKAAPKARQRKSAKAA